MNLAVSPWIPCAMLDGSRKLYSLAELFENAHHVRRVFGDTPLETAAMMRLFLAIIHRARNGPAGAPEWAAIWQLGRFGKPESDYLRHWFNRFSLYDGASPFYQFVPEQETRMISIAKPQPDRSSGNNSTLFDYSLDDDPAPVNEAKAARIVVSSQAFSLGEAGGFKHGHCARGDVYFVEGQSLFETLMFNLLPYNQDSPIPNTLDDRPAWEQDDPFNPDRDTPYGWLDLLTWQSRRTILYPESDGSVRWMYWMPGLMSDPDLKDPMMCYWYRATTKAWIPSKTNRFLPAWQNLDRAIRATPTTVPIQAAGWVIQLARDGWLNDYLTASNPPMRLGVYSIISSMARVDGLLQEILPFPLMDIANEDSKFIEAVKTARAVSNILQFVFKSTSEAEYGKGNKSEIVRGKNTHWKSSFWYKAYPRFEAIFGHGGGPFTDEDLQAWRDSLRETCANVYQQYAETGTTRGLRAYGLNVGLLRALLYKAFRDPDQWANGSFNDDDDQEGEEADEAISE